MKQQLTVNNGSPRLILILSGWATDASTFSALNKEGYDIMVVYDYENADFDPAPLRDYREIVVIAWSMGVVFVPAIIKRHPSLPFTKVIAVNGSLTPVDDNRGIPEAIFSATTLIDSPRALDKFYRRIYGGQSALEALMPQKPDRDLPQLVDELHAIKRFAVGNEVVDSDYRLFDLVIVSENDLIFPPENLKRSWLTVENRVVTKQLPHAFDFQQILDSYIIDKLLVGQRFESASPVYNETVSAQRVVAQKLASIVKTAVKSTSKPKVIEIGAGEGLLTNLCLPSFDSPAYEAWDLTPAMTKIDGVDRIVCDAETAIREIDDSSVDIVLSSSTIQWFNSPRRFLREVARTLRPGGQAFIAYYGSGSFKNIARSGVTLDYPSIELDLFDDLDVEVAESQTMVEARFDSPLDALGHLRSTGVNSLRRKPLGVAATRQILRLLANPDNSASLHFDARFLTISKKSTKHGK